MNETAVRSRLHFEIFDVAFGSSFPLDADVETLEPACFSQTRCNVLAAFQWLSCALNRHVGASRHQRYDIANLHSMSPELSVSAGPEIRVRTRCVDRSETPEGVLFFYVKVTVPGGLDVSCSQIKCCVIDQLGRPYSLGQSSAIHPSLCSILCHSNALLLGQVRCWISDAHLPRIVVGNEGPKLFAKSVVLFGQIQLHGIGYHFSPNGRISCSNVQASRGC
jgi:hypothetical protein